jgi:hypothetical protein
MRLLGILLACFLGVQALSQGVIRLEPSGGVLVPIPVFPALVEQNLSLQAYLVSHDVLTPLTPITSVRLDASGTSPVQPAQITLPEFPDSVTPTFRLRVWDPRYGASYSEAGAFFNGQSDDIALNSGSSFTPTLFIIPEPNPAALLVTGLAALFLFPRRLTPLFQPPAKTGRKPA